MEFLEEIQKRRTFGIISHPDAGKTTLTEKLLLYGGAIQEAGAVKSNKIKKHFLFSENAGELPHLRLVGEHCSFFLKNLRFCFFFEFP